MLEATGASRYADVMETTLYNAVLAGVSLDGERFFYTNTLRQLDDMPVELRWSRRRQEFISCFCCPPNVTRLIAGLNRYAYGRSDRTLWVNLFGSSSVRTQIAPDQFVAVEQKTNYPWDGRIHFEVTESPADEWTLSLRIPSWAEGATLRINSDEPTSPAAGTFLTIQRRWSAGDVVVLELPMRVRSVESHPLVEETRNHVAIQRGPIVYCLESCDLPKDTSLQDASLRRESIWTPQSDKQLAGATVLEGMADLRATSAWSGTLYREAASTETRSLPVRLVPYFTWGNRGDTEMTVWLPLTTR